MKFWPPKVFFCSLAAMAGLVTGGSATPPPYPQVFRNFMPEAGPSAFVVALGSKLSLCYDPLRGGVSQIWSGGFDLGPTMAAKINQPTVFEGDVFYAETVLQPLRTADPAKPAERRFKGYHYADGVVTFEFTLDGVRVSEILRPTADGLGVEREWRTMDADEALYFTAESQTAAEVSFSGGEEVKPGLWKSDANGNETFTQIIKPKPQS